MRLPGLLLVMLVTVTCTTDDAVNGPTPGNGPGPAIEMTVIGEVPCRGGVVARTCVQVRLTNRGARGGGSCVMWATVPGSDGDRTIDGPRTAVTDLASGASVTEILAWTSPLPTAERFYFQTSCDPGLRS